MGSVAFCLQMCCCGNKPGQEDPECSWLTMRWKPWCNATLTSQCAEQLMTGLWTNSWHSVSAASVLPLYPSVGLCCFARTLPVSSVDEDLNGSSSDVRIHGLLAKCHAMVRCLLKFLSRTCESTSWTHWNLNPSYCLFKISTCTIQQLIIESRSSQKKQSVSVEWIFDCIGKRRVFIISLRLNLKEWKKKETQDECINHWKN